jgi:hypothetical protein
MEPDPDTCDFDAASRWYVKTPDKLLHTSVFFYTDNKSLGLAIEFQEIPPTYINILRTGRSYTICTDGTIQTLYEMDCAELDTKQLGRWIQVPSGMRYGTYMAQNNTMTYLAEFWKVPRAEYDDSPIMMSIRPRDIKSYIFS